MVTLPLFLCYLIVLFLLSSLFMDKKPVGRPKTGTALTSAQKQRAYRERLRERHLLLNSNSISWDIYRSEMDRALARSKVRINMATSDLSKAKANSAYAALAAFDVFFSGTFSPKE